MSNINSNDILVNSLDNTTTIEVNSSHEINKDCGTRDTRLYFDGEFRSGNIISVYLDTSFDPDKVYTVQVSSGSINIQTYPWLWTLPNTLTDEVVSITYWS
jgi:hypothetical protein